MGNGIRKPRSEPANAGPEPAGKHPVTLNCDAQRLVQGHDPGFRKDHESPDIPGGDLNSRPFEANGQGADSRRIDQLIDPVPAEA